MYGKRIFPIVDADANIGRPIFALRAGSRAGIMFAAMA